ncbi:MAG: thioredoxin family protein [Candidatus Heimdallarchaeota archaeon]|nr:thioredoxin family protein [Candidatus Heimdallarchaeota archaeon]
MTNTIEMTDANYEDLIASNKLLVLDTWAEWCAPCRKSTPVFEEMSNTMASDDFVFAKLDTQHNQEAAAAFKILSLPTFMVFKDGNLINRWTGADIGRLRKEITALTE